MATKPFTFFKKGSGGDGMSIRQADKLPRNKAAREGLRKRIMDAVWKAFCEVGYSRLDFPVIMRSLRISRGAIYFHWRGGIAGSNAGACDRMVCDAVLHGLGSIFSMTAWTRCAEQVGERIPQSYLYDLIRRGGYDAVRDLLCAKKTLYEKTVEYGDLDKSEVLFGHELLRELQG